MFTGKEHTPHSCLPCNVKVSSKSATLMKSLKFPENEKEKWKPLFRGKPVEKWEDSFR